MYIKELRKRLSILNEEEVDDITDEYNDFIANKVLDGYSEQEAIDSLGDVNYLARRILEAYKISDKYIKWFVGKERLIDDINDYTTKVADSSIDVLNKIENSLKDIFKKTAKFGEERVHDVKNIFKKKENDTSIVEDEKTID